MWYCTRCLIYLISKHINYTFNILTTYYLSLVWNWFRFHCSVTNTQKQKSMKLAVGARRRTSVQSSGSVETIESVKKAPKSIKASPNKSSTQSQEETYRVCKLHCSGPAFFLLSYCICKFAKSKALVCLHVGNSGRARPGAGAALEGRAGCKETYWTSQEPAVSSERGKGPSEFGLTHHRQVRTNCSLLKQRNIVSLCFFVMFMPLINVNKMWMQIEQPN